MRLSRKVYGVSSGGVIVPSAQALPIGDGKPGERVSVSKTLNIVLTPGTTQTHQFDFAHPDKSPSLRFTVFGLFIVGRTKEAQRLQEELEKGPKKGQGKGGLESELHLQRAIEIFLTLEWATGFTNEHARNDPVAFQTIEKGEASGDYLAYEEVGPGSWGFARAEAHSTSLDHQILTLTSTRKGGEGELKEARLQLGVVEEWNEGAVPGGHITSGTIVAGQPSVGFAPSGHVVGSVGPPAQQLLAPEPPHSA